MWPLVVHCVKYMLLEDLVQFEIGQPYSVGFRDAMAVLLFEKKAKKKQQKMKKNNIDVMIMMMIMIIIISIVISLLHSNKNKIESHKIAAYSRGR